MKKILPTSLLTLGVLLSFGSPAYAANTVVTESQATFDKDTLDIKAGDTVTFTNKDRVNHDVRVVSYAGETIRQETQKPGEDVTVTFSEPGLYWVRSDVSPHMKIQITVQ